MIPDLTIRRSRRWSERAPRQGQDVAILDTEAEAVTIMAERQDELAEVFERYAPSIHHFFVRRGYGREDSRDLTQDTFVKAYKGLSGFRDQASLQTWLLSIATNVWKNDLRSRQAEKRSAMQTVAMDALPVEEERPIETESVAAAPSRPPNPLDEVLARERRVRLRAAIDDLPPRMRHVVQLRIDRGLRYQEIALVLQVSVDTVKTQLHQARRRLKETLAEYEDLGEDGS